MPIAFDAVSNSLTTGASAPLAHTVANQPNRLLIVAVNGINRASAVSYAGVAMTLFGSVTNATTGRTIDIWYQIAPTVGANNITFTGGTLQIAIGLSYYGVRQSAFPDGSHTTPSASGTSHSETVTTVADNSWLVGFVDTDDGTTGPGANTVQRTAAVSVAFDAYDSNSGKTPPGNDAINFTAGIASQWASIAVSVAPASAAQMFQVF